MKMKGSEPTNSRWQWENLRGPAVFFGLAGVTLAAALLVGISDNLPGVTLLYVASTSLVLAFAHRWRKVRSFVILLAASLLGFFVAAVMHNLIYGLGELSQQAILKSALEALHVVFFLVAILLCPAGVLVGGVGSLIAWRRAR